MTNVPKKRSKHDDLHHEACSQAATRRAGAPGAPLQEHERHRDCLEPTLRSRQQAVDWFCYVLLCFRLDFAGCGPVFLGFCLLFASSELFEAQASGWSRRGSEIESYEFLISQDPKFPKHDTRRAACQVLGLISPWFRWRAASLRVGKAWEDGERTPWNTMAKPWQNSLKPCKMHQKALKIDRKSLENKRWQ